MAIKPSVLRGIDEPEGENPMDVLVEDQELLDETPDETPEEGETPEEETEETPDEEESSDDSDASEEETPDETPEETPEETNEEKEAEEAPEEGEKIFGKYKTIEEAEAAYKELERTLHSQAEKLKKGLPEKPEDMDEKQKELANLLKYPMVKIQQPKSEDYRLNDGNFDLDGYMRDYTKSIVLGMQREMLQGSLGAVFYGQVADALSEQHTATIQQSTQEKEARSTLEYLVDKYPVLGKDKAIERAYQRALEGEYQMRSRQAQQNGEEFTGLVREDYENVLIDIIGAQGKPETPERKDPTEKVKGGPSLTDTPKKKVDPVDDAIDGMMENKKNSTSFF